MENNTEVVFDNIEQRILNEIKEAHYAIFVSVAWFTNKKLFQALLEKAKNNCYVSIIIQLDDINSQSGIDYSQIQVGRSECFMISKEAELLHDKFCVIDFRKVITGSYNWTYKAAHNSENILILNDPSVATQYITRFEQQKAKYNPSSVPAKAANKIVNPSQVNQIITAISPIPTIKKCEHCKNQIAITDTFCPWCGKQQRESKFERSIICKHCSHKQVDPILDGNTFYCTNCGRELLQRKNHTDICPICQNHLKDGKYCSSCGLPKHIFSHSVMHTKPVPPSNPLQDTRPEFRLFGQYQKCHQCTTPNLFRVNFCRKCGDSLSTKAKDRNGNGWVDLGLSVLWSTGTMWGFYDWMDATPFMYGGYSPQRPFKQNNMQDVASERWGSKWRTPTKEEFEELLNLCTWEKTFVPNQTQVVKKYEMRMKECSIKSPNRYLPPAKGEKVEKRLVPISSTVIVKTRALKVTGPNGNYILLPATNCFDRIGEGDMSFWTSTKDANKEGHPFAFQYSFSYQQSDEEWISTPFDKEISLRRIRYYQQTALCILPVADKKWQGQI